MLSATDFMEWSLAIDSKTKSCRRLDYASEQSGMDSQLVAANEVLYHTQVRRPLQDVLTAIRYGIPVASCGRRLKANAEHSLHSPYTFARLFADDPAAIVRTQEIADRCGFSLTEIRYRYPSEHMPDGTTSTDWLRHLTFEGAHQRYGRDIPADVADQLGERTQDNRSARLSRVFPDHARDR